MRYFSQYTSLFDSLSQGHLILTPNQRLSRFIHTQYALYQKERYSCQGQMGVKGSVACDSESQVWPRIQCLPYQSWLRSVWDTEQARGRYAPTAKVVLDSAHTRSLWLDIIQGDDSVDVLSSDRMVDAVNEAWETLKLWNQSIDDIPLITEEASLAAKWMRQFEDRCEELSVIAPCCLPEHIATFFSLHPPSQLSVIVLLGFDDLIPSQKALFDTLSRHSVQVREVSISLNANTSRLALSEYSEEIEVAARWAKACLLAELEKNDKSNTTTIGIVIPDLSQKAHCVEHIFNCVFEPQSILPHHPRHASAYNISAAEHLNQTPPIRTVFDILQLANTSCDRELVSRFLLSPFHGDESEFTARAALDKILRQKYHRVSLHVLRSEAGEQEGGVRCPDLYRRLCALQEFRVGNDVNKQSPEVWANVFFTQLQIFGWPGSRIPDTLEYQQIQSWPEVLKKLTHLSLVKPLMSVSEALSSLRCLAQVPFHAQTKHSPIQVLGLLEAAGQQFDYLWVAGLDNRHWPTAPSPNSFLPLAFQKSLGMPRSSIEKELDYARRLTGRLSQSAHTVIYSWASSDGDEVLSPSPLIEDFPEVVKGDLLLCELIDYSAIIGDEKCLEFSVDDCGPAVDPRRISSGGTQIIKDYAACAFRAFARHRLNAENENDIELGITSLQKGNLIHVALEIIWRRLKVQRALLALSEEGLTGLIHSSLEQAWVQLSLGIYLGENTKAIEFQRSTPLLRAWMELEKNRPPFTVVFNETERTFSLGGLPMRIRYDRVDELDDGSLLVIDYKTGKVNIKDWEGERPNEPQVPIYCIAQGDDVKSAAYGQLHVDEVSFKGLSHSSSAPSHLKAPQDLKRSDLPDSWGEVIASWRDNLERLANEYMAGVARVNPKAPSQTCRYCDLHALCRIRNISAQEDL